MCRVRALYPACMSKEKQLAALQKRLRAVRQAKGLTLNQVSTLSNGAISAIALGSYERGDRSLSTEKLFEIAELYGVPMIELLSPPEKGISAGRVIIDLRKLSLSTEANVQAPLRIIERITQMRHDWNGEVISLRSTDVGLLQIFANYSESQTRVFLENFALAKLK